MTDTFGPVRERAAHGGELLGVPDFLDRDTQLEYALDHLAALHGEIGRLNAAASAAANAAHDAVAAARLLVSGGSANGPSKSDRRASAKRRRRGGQLSFGQYLRVRLWIEMRSDRAAREAALQALEQTVATTTAPSRFAGDQPVRSLLRAGEYDRAYVLARALMPLHRQNRRFISLVQEIQRKRGSISSVIALARMADGRRSSNTFALRKLEGRLREVSGWYPRLPGPVERVLPVDETTVLHLVKESRPYLSNGFTSRSHHNFLAEAAAGLRPVVVSEPGFPSREGVELAGRVEILDGIEHHRIDGAGFADDIPLDTYLQVFAQEALRVVRKVRPALLHASSGRRGYETALVAMALAEKTGLPFVYEVRSFFESLWTPDKRWEEQGETFARRIAVEQMCMQRADVVLTLGESMRDELVRRGADPQKIEIVPNGVDLASFQPAGRPLGLGSELGLGSSPTFGYVSNLDHPRESQETLVRAAAVLAGRGIEARCVLVGGGARTQMVRELADELGVADRVVLTGPVDHTSISRYYELIDVFVVPRIDERAARYVTPLKPFEAMALARPVVAADLPALREIVDPPHRGMVFPPGDHHALADILTELFADPGAMTAMGEAGRAWVTRERQWSMNGARYARAFARARREADDHAG